MKYLILTLLLFSLPLSASDIYSLKVKTIEGKETLLNEYKGKTLLVVNIASRCGYTPQLEGLEALHKKYEKEGLVVLGLPSNDFGGQAPESNKDFKKFCKLRYGVSFPLLEKMQVIGDNKHPLINTLLQSSENKNEIAWNFEKFVINKKGQVVKRFPSRTSPTDPEFVKTLTAQLKGDKQ